MAPDAVTMVRPIDLGAWTQGAEHDRDSVAAAMDDACSSTGFLALVGHGVDHDLLAEMLDVTGRFFDRPLDEKLRYRTGDLEGNRGYAAEGTEALSYSLGEDSPPDLFEAFNVGCERVPVGLSELDRARFFAPNVWPDSPAELRSVWLRYWDEVQRVADTVMEVAARALGLPDGWFGPYLNESPTVMRANNYQRRGGVGAAEPGQQRMGAHSDYGSITVLLADPVPGLQIRDDAGQWHDALPPENGFIVNVADLLAEWTNDRWRSTIHRVAPPSGDVEGEFRRRSVAWFQQPNFDAVIEVLDTCVSSDNPPRYQPTTSGEHLLAKLMGPRTFDRSAVGEEFTGAHRGDQP